jgi:predicted metal-dependent hydrolase
MSEQLSLLLDVNTEAVASLTPAPSQIATGSKWREINHQGIQIGFVLTRSRRRSIGFMVGEEGLRIAAPSWVTLTQIDAAIIEKMPWVLNKLKAMQERRTRLTLATKSWQPGGAIPYLAKHITLQCGPGANLSNRGKVSFEGNALQPESGQTLWLPIPADSDSSRIREVAQSWLQQQAKHWFGLRISHFQAQTGLTIKSWRLSNALGRWGSCTSDRVIALNWRLIHFSPSAIDYVIAHEMAHLRELNHSQDFWAEVKAIYPDYIQARQALKKFSPGDLPDATD